MKKNRKDFKKLQKGKGTGSENVIIGKNEKI